MVGPIQSRLVFVCTFIFLFNLDVHRQWKAVSSCSRCIVHRFKKKKKNGVLRYIAMMQLDTEARRAGSNRRWVYPANEMHNCQSRLEQQWKTRDAVRGEKDVERLRGEDGFSLRTKEILWWERQWRHMTVEAITSENGAKKNSVSIYLSYRWNMTSSGNLSLSDTPEQSI